MPYLIALFGTGIKYLAAYAVARIFLAIGLSYVVYQGFDILMESIKSEIESNYSAMAAGVFEIVTMMGADVAISILFSAISIRLVISAVSGGVKSGLRFTGVSGAT